MVSKIKRICKLMLEKNNNFGLMKAKNVSIHRRIQIIESNITDLRFLKLFNMEKQHLIYMNII